MPLEHCARDEDSMEVMEGCCCVGRDTRKTQHAEKPGSVKEKDKETGDIAYTGVWCAGRYIGRVCSVGHPVLTSILILRLRCTLHLAAGDIEIAQRDALFMMTSRGMIALLVYCSLLVSCRAGYAPKDAPKLPEGFCPSDTGDVTGI